MENNILYPYVLHIKWIQVIRIYKTHSKYFLVGSNKEETRFKVLKVDRTQPLELAISQDNTEYNLQEISKVIETLHAGNSGKSNSKFWQRGLVQSSTAFGLIGFVRFLEGYYMILITKRVKVAELGGHSIYKIEDTSMIYIPNSTVRISKPEESKYLKSFQTVDLSSNFYFSYSYDLSNNLQHIMCMLNSSQILPKENTVIKKTENDEASLSSDSTIESWDEVPMHSEHLTDYKCSKKRKQKAINIKPCHRFVWNNFLLKETLDQNINDEWFVNIVHGFIQQIHIDIYGKPVYITLIARRSSLYAGTRFLKRGCNVNGDVANEVETEQIVHSGSITSFEHGHYTSYVQHRGSVPVYWYQDINANVVPAKPPINLGMPDPFAQAAAKHFSQLLKRFGSPIVVLNLVRKKERKPHESILGGSFKTLIEYLNTFLPVSKQIVYIDKDMAQLSRAEKSNVLTKLDKIALDSIEQTGIFQNQVHLFSQTLNDDKKWTRLGGTIIKNIRLQTGVLRTNCVDCLDRTNSAQFIAAKCALGYQLFALGILPKPKVDFDTDAVSVFEEIFEDHGDIIALQYGGSQLVHTIQSYRRTEAAIAAHSRDIVTTLSRYYSNTFSDAYKQSAINLFLGVFQPSIQTEHQWDMITDIYLHNDVKSVLQSFNPVTYRMWCDPVIKVCLPLPVKFVINSQSINFAKNKKSIEISDDENDWYTEHYDCHNLTSFDDLFTINLLSSTTELQESNSSQEDPSPFAVRGEKSHDIKQYTNISTSISSQSSLDDSISSSSLDADSLSISSDSDYNLNIKYSSLQQKLSFSSNNKKTSDDLRYGNIHNYELSRKDINTYKRHVQVEDILNKYIPLSVFSQDSLVYIEPPTVDKHSRNIYEKSVACCTRYPTMLLSKIEDYKAYVNLPH